MGGGHVLAVDVPVARGRVDPAHFAPCRVHDAISVLPAGMGCGVVLRIVRRVVVCVGSRRASTDAASGIHPRFRGVAARRSVVGLWIVAAANTALKVGPALAIPFVSDLPFDPWWAMFLPLGLALGWLARAGRMVGEHKPWLDIRRDLIVSLLISGANGLIAAIVIGKLDLPYLAGMGVSFVCAFSGVQSLDTAVSWAKRYVTRDVERKLTRADVEEMLGDNRARSQAAISEQALQAKGIILPPGIRERDNEP